MERHDDNTGTVPLSCRNAVDVLDQSLRFRALTWCLMRHVIEKYGGIMEVHQDTNVTAIAVPPSAENVCFRELKALLDYASS